LDLNIIFIAIIILLLIYIFYIKNNHAYKNHNEYSATQKDVDTLKSNYKLTIQKRVTELKTTNLYLDTIFEAYPDILIVTSGNAIEKVNSKFLNFTKFKNLDAFKEVYSCICNKFEEVDGYLQAGMVSL